MAGSGWNCAIRSPWGAWLKYDGRKTQLCASALEFAVQAQQTAKRQANSDAFPIERQLGARVQKASKVAKPDPQKPVASREIVRSNRVRIGKPSGESPIHSPRKDFLRPARLARKRGVPCRGPLREGRSGCLGLKPLLKFRLIGPGQFSKKNPLSDDGSRGESPQIVILRRAERGLTPEGERVNETRGYGDGCSTNNSSRAGSYT